MASDQKSEFTDEQRLAAIRRKILRKEKEKNVKKRKQRQEQKKRLRPAWIKEKRKNNRSNSSSSAYSDSRRNLAYSRTLKVHIIETEEETDEAIRKLKSTEFVGFDCEGLITLGRTGKLSLIQVSDDDNIYLFDILAMNYVIPLSLSQWLSSDHCIKFIHDSRQDQDSLYHCHGISFGGIFDTTIADLVQRCWVAKSRSCGRLKGMDSLAHDVIHRISDYKVMFNINMRQTSKYLKLSDLTAKKEKKEEEEEGDGDGDGDNDGDSVGKEVVAAESVGTGNKWKRIKVNCFDQKQSTKSLMRADAKLWGYRPMAINLVIYAAVDGYVSLLMGQYFRRKFRDWMIDKTLFVSAKWCRSVAKQTRVRASSSKVPSSIVKLIRSNTADMAIDDIPAIDQKLKYHKERQKNLENINDAQTIDFGNLLLMADRIHYIPRRLEDKMNPNSNNHEEGILDYVTDIYKLDYDTNDHSSYVRVGKLNYSRLVPLKLIENEIETL